jgi:serine/threonine protein kinase/dipeptidyl aminopeptidase/acylaminoacyl peptidase
MPLGAGARLGPYEVVAPLGAGGMGEVYRARDSRLGREVAIKVIAAGREVDPQRLRRFADEARAAGALNHPNVLAIFDTGLDADPPYVVFELLEGDTLRHRLQQGPLPARKAVEYAAQVCDGLAAAHEKGIVHRDLKPDNLFLTRDGRIKILDFGLAKLRESPGTADASSVKTPTITTPGMLVGTVAYMSPEQVRGETADARSDLFAVGATLHEMLTGRPAFLRSTSADTLSAILTQDPPELAPSPDNPVPAALGPILRRCLEKDAGQRFQSARDLGFALSVLSGSTTSDVAGTRSARPRARRWLLPLIVGAVVVGTAASLVFRRSSGPPTEPLRPIPFTAFRGQEVAPSFSPDGSQIAFAWTGEDEARESLFHLYVEVIGGEKPLRLTTHPGEWIAPAWSPDGRRIAFARGGQNAPGIFLVPALGGQERKLLDMPSEYFSFSLQAVLSWSPDGKRLAFADGDGISVLDVETLERRRLGGASPDCQRTWMPAFSPDGKSLAVACSLSLSRERLFVMPAIGGVGRPVLAAPYDLSGLAWTPDGRFVVFTADGDLWRVRPEGGEAEKLLAGRDAQLPAVSLEGHRLAYTQQVYNTNIWRLPLADPTRPAGPPERLVSSTRSQRYPTFSPDGSRLAFESTRSGAFEIWTCAKDGSDCMQLTSFGGPLTGSPQWSPNGGQIVFDSRATGDSSALYVVGPEGGPPRRLDTGMGESSTPAWSRDGRFIYFSAPVGTTPQVFRCRTEGGSATQITKRGGSYPHASPDGRRVYYARYADRSEIWSASVDGGDEEPVSGVPPRSGKWEPDFLVSSSGIYFIDGDPPRPGIHFLDFASGRTKRVADIPGRPEIWGGGLALSPDGRSLLFSQLDEIASDIMLIEGFR